MKMTDSQKQAAEHAAHMKELPCSDSETGEHIWEKQKTGEECELCGEHIYK